MALTAFRFRTSAANKAGLNDHFTLPRANEQRYCYAPGHQVRRAPKGRVSLPITFRTYVAQPARVSDPGNELAFCYHTVIHRVLLEKPIHRADGYS